MKNNVKITEVIQVLKDLGMPKGQQNDRTALCLLALLNLTQRKKWKNAQSPLIGITPMMDFARDCYGAEYAPNTRETFRRSSVHQLVEAGIVLQNPDDPSRPVNSPKTVYQLAPEALSLLRKYGSSLWKRSLAVYLKKQGSLAKRYAGARKMKRIPVRIKKGKTLHLSAGKHSQLTKEVIRQFLPRFMPDADLLYVGDTKKKWAYLDEQSFQSLGLHFDPHGKMPDVVVHDRKKKWLVLVEVVTSHGPMNPKRHEELKTLFAKARDGLVFVTVFPTRSGMLKYWNELAWETEVWVAEHPEHMIHLNGIRFLGPYEKNSKKRGSK